MQDRHDTIPAPAQDDDLVKLVDYVEGMFAAIEAGRAREAIEIGKTVRGMLAARGKPETVVVRRADLEWVVNPLEGVAMPWGMFEAWKRLREALKP